MLPPAALAAHLLLTGVLVAAGAGKLLRRADTLASLATLGVPAFLRRSPAVRAHPWVEITLGVALLVLPFPAALVPAVLCLALLSGYLLLVARALAAGRAGPCACFGLGEAGLSGVTLTRNVLLVALAVVVVVDTAGGASAAGRLAGLGGDAWWLLALVTTAAPTALVLPAADGAPQGAEPVGPAPDVVVLDAAGRPVRPAELATAQPLLLLALSPTCGPCLHLTDQLPRYADLLPGIAVRVLTSLGADEAAAAVPAWRGLLLSDPDGAATSALRLDPQPSAVLLDGRGLVTGPARGPRAVERFVTALAATRRGPGRPRSGQPRVRS